MEIIIGHKRLKDAQAHYSYSYFSPALLEPLLCLSIKFKCFNISAGSYVINMCQMCVCVFVRVPALIETTGLLKSIVYTDNHDRLCGGDDPILLLCDE